MSMYEDILRDQENTIILLCQHMRRLLTIVEAYADMDEEEKFLVEVMEKQGIESGETND